MGEHTEVVSIEEVVSGIFDEALSVPLESVKVDPDTAKRWTQDRVRRLSLFDRDGTPPDLRDSYKKAIEATRMSEELCLTSLQAVRLVAPIGSMTKPDIFKRAKMKLDAGRASIGGSVDDRSSAIWSKVFVALYGEIANPTEVETFGKLLDWWFKDSPEIEKFIAKTEGSLLIAMHEQLEAEQFFLVALAFLQVISNGMFYHTIVKKHGS